MPRKAAQRYAGDDVSGWSDAQLAHVAAMDPERLQPLGFARWPHDPGEEIGIGIREMMTLQRDAAAELERRA